MNTYKGIIQYKGNDYLGWQIQENQGKTIQGELNKALQKISKSKNVRTIGSGRTDAGVHAIGQVFKAEIELKINPDSLTRALNSNLPKDIYVKSVDVCAEDFHPVFHASKKEYNYLFVLDKEMAPFMKELITHYPYKLDIDLMNKGCKLFEGKHDFLNYFCVGTDVNSTIRTITKCEIVKIKSEGFQSNYLESYYLLKIEGTGFLKQMVRLIMGTLWSLGKNKILLSDIEGSFSTKLKDKLGVVAPPEGLYLKEVHYK